MTEDDTPADSIFSERQQRLLTEGFYASWPGPGNNRPFLALAYVGLFYNINQPPLAPDAPFIPTGAEWMVARLRELGIELE